MTLEKMKKEVMELMEDYFDQLIEERMDVIGQNGNEGLHYKGDDLPLHYVDYGSGHREVQHIMKPYKPNDVNFEKEYWAKLRDLPEDEEDDYI